MHSLLKSAVEHVHIVSSSDLFN